MRLHPLFIFVFFLFSAYPSSFARKKKRVKKKPLVVQLVVLSIRGIKNYSYDTYDFYKRFLMGTCTKKERKKAKRNLRWYRNGIIGMLIIGGVKWKVDAAWREADLFIEQKKQYVQTKALLVPHRINHPTPRQKEMEEAIKNKIRKEIVKELKRGKEIAQKQIGEWFIEAGYCAYKFFEKSERRVLWQLGIAKHRDDNGVYRLDKKQNS